MIEAGLLFALLAMLCWGIGDFLIQKSVRKIGDIEALFCISLFGTIVLSPFVYKKLPALFTGSHQTLIILGILCLVLFIAAILDFEALRVGKLSVVEPIWSFEVPVSALLALVILKETISLEKIVLIILLLLGLALVSLKNTTELRKLIFEKGAFIALLAAILMGGANFLMGWSSRLSDPIMANFIANIFIASILAIILLLQGKAKAMIKDFILNKKILLQMSLLDNIAWVAFAFAMSLAPIGIIVALSESYIIVAVVLGLTINKEKIRFHQKIGLVVAIISAIVLASITA